MKQSEKNNGIKREMGKEKLERKSAPGREGLIQEPCSTVYSRR